jgi:hypothetical protein
MTVFNLKSRHVDQVVDPDQKSQKFLLLEIMIGINWILYDR